MTTGSHKCPAPGCQTQVALHQLTCKRHWFEIPKPLRDDVWAAYDKGRGMGSPEHTVAIAEACAFLRNRTGEVTA